MEAIKANIETMREGKGVGKIRDKELMHAYRVIDADAPTDKNGYVDTYVDARIYCGRSRSAEMVYAIIWASGRDSKGESVYGRGVGSAGGWGRDKASVALGEAISNAGIELSTRINGVGETAIVEAVKGIASALGASRPIVVEAFA